jgi:hypothetical protein
MKGIADQYSELSIISIDGGRVIASVDYQLSKVIENCLDVNTEPKVPRSVTLKITIKPTSDRTKAEIEYQASAKLAADATGADTLTFGRDAKAYVPKSQIEFDEWLANKEEEINPETGEVTEIPRITREQNGGER